MSLGSVKQNIITLTISNLIIGLIEFVFNLYLSRVFGAEGLGLLSMITPINCLFLSFMTEGLVVTMSKISSRHQHFQDFTAMNRTVKIATVFSFLWSLCLSVLLFVSAKFIAVSFLGDSSLTYPILSVCPLMLLMSISNIIKGHFLGLAKIKIPSAINVSEKLLRFPILYLLIRFFLNNAVFPPITMVYLCYALGETQSVVLLLIYYLRTKPAVPVYSSCHDSARSSVTAHSSETAYSSKTARSARSYRKILLPLIKGATPICLTQCLLELSNSFCSVIVKSRLCSIGYTASKALTLMGMYKGMVFPLMTYPMILVSSICSIVVPKISTLASAGKPEPAGRLIQKVLLTSFLIGLVTSLLFFLFADQMGIFFYKRSDLTLMIHLSGACAPLLYVTSATTSLLISVGQESLSFRNTLFQQLLLLILLLLLTGIPALNIYGYITAIALSNIALLFKNLSALRKYQKPI